MRQLHFRYHFFSEIKNSRADRWFVEYHNENDQAVICLIKMRLVLGRTRSRI